MANIVATQNNEWAKLKAEWIVALSLFNKKDHEQIKPNDLIAIIEAFKTRQVVKALAKGDSRNFEKFLAHCVEWHSEHGSHPVGKLAQYTKKPEQPSEEDTTKEMSEAQQALEIAWENIVAQSEDPNDLGGLIVALLNRLSYQVVANAYPAKAALFYEIKIREQREAEIKAMN